MSTSIDNKIVHLEFDNSKFESRVKTTMSTLSKLKEKLNFGKNINTDLEKVGKTAKNLDLSSISNNVENLNSRFSTLGIVGMTAIQNLTNGAMALGKKLGSLLISGGINRALNIEQAKFTIEGLGKSFRDLRGDINYAVEGTAYGFDEAAKAASSLSASGIEAGQDMREGLRGISGMAAMTGSSYSDIADIFTTVAGQGRILSQQLNQFSSRGINAAAVLTDFINKNEDLRNQVIEVGLASKQASKVEEFANATQLTEENIRTLVSASSIDFKTFSKAMDDAFGEHAKSANKTFTGALSNIKASLARMGEKFVLPAIETNDKDAMLVQTYKNYDDALEKVAQSARKASDSNAGLKAKFIDAIKENKKYAGITEEEIVKLLDTGDKEFEKSIKKIPQYSNKTTAELRAMFNTEQEEFRAQARELPKYANMSDKQLDQIYKKYKGVQFNLVTVIQALKRVFGVFETTIANSKALSVFLDMLDKTSKAMSYFLNAIAATFTTLEHNGKTVSGVIEIVTNGGKSKLVSATKLWDGLRKTLGLSVRTFKNIGDTFKGVISIFSIAWKIIKAVFDVLANGINVFTPLAKIIFAVTGGIGRFITSIDETLTKSAVLVHITKIITTVLQYLRIVINWVCSGIEYAVSLISDNPILEKIHDSVISIVSIFGKLIEVIQKIASVIAGPFISAFGAVGKSFNVVESIVDFILGGIASGLDFIVSGLDNLVTVLNNFASNIPGLDSISKFSENVGALTAGGIISAVTKGFSLLGKAIGSISFKSIEKLGDEIKDIFSKITNLDFSKVSSTIVSVFKNIGYGLLIAGIIISDGVASITDALKSLVSKTDSSGSEAGKVLENLVTNIFELLGTIGKLIYSSFSSLFQTLYKSAPDPQVIGTTLGDILTKGFMFLAKSIPTLIGILGAALGTVVANLPNILMSFAEGIKKAISDMLSASTKEGVTEGSEKAVQWFKKIGDRLKKAFDFITGFLSKLTFRDVLAGITTFFTGSLVKALIDFIKMLTNFGNGLKKTNNSFAGVMGKMQKTLVDYQKTLKADRIMVIAKAIAVLVGALFVLSLIPVGPLIKGITAMAALALILGLMLKSLSKLDTATQTLPQILALTSVFVKIGVAMLLLAMAVKILGNMDPLTLIKGLGAVTVLLVGMMGSLAILANSINGLQSNVAITAGQIIAISIALVILTKAVSALGKLDLWSLGKGLLGLATMMFTMCIAVSLLASENANMVKIGVGFLLLAIGVRTLAGALVIVSNIPLLNLMTALIGIGVAVGILTASAVKLQTGVAPLIAIGQAMLLLSASLVILAGIPLAQLLTALVGIAGTLAIITIATKALGPTAIPTLGALAITLKAVGFAALAITGGLLLAAIALQKLADLGNSEDLAGLGNVLATVVAGIGKGLVDIILAIGDASAGIADAIVSVIIKIVETIANNFVRLVTAGAEIIGAILKGIADNIGKITEMAGKCIIGFMDGLSAVMPDLINSAINLAVEFLNGLALGIEQNTDKIMSAVANLLASIINFVLDSFGAIFGKIPVIGDKIKKGVEGAKKGVNKVLRDGKTAAAVDAESKEAERKFDSNMKKIAKSSAKEGKNAKQAFIKQLAEMYPNMKFTSGELSKLWEQYGKKAVDSTKKSSKKMKDANKKGTKDIKDDTKKDLDASLKEYDKLGDAGKLLKNSKGTLKSLKGMNESYAKAGKKNSKAYTDGLGEGKGMPGAIKSLAERAEKANKKHSFKPLGENVSKGYAKGVKDKSGTVYTAVEDLVKEAYKRGKDAQKSKSPSKLYSQLGGWAIEGYAIGMYKSEKYVSRAASMVVKDAADNVKNLTTALFDSPFEDLQDPVIRPILDTSGITSGVNQLDSIFNKQYSVGIAGSMNVQNPRLMGNGNSSQGNKTISLTTNLTVNGAEDGTKLADDFARELEIQARSW